MKMSDYKEDKVLEEFFAGMKSKDKDLNIPTFPIQRKPILYKLTSLGIAASLLLMMYFYLGNEESDYQIQEDIIIITFEEGADQEYHFSIESTSNLDIWESPTSSLLTEF